MISRTVGLERSRNFHVNLKKIKICTIRFYDGLDLTKESISNMTKNIRLLIEKIIICIYNKFYKRKRIYNQ